MYCRFVPRLLIPVAISMVASASFGVDGVTEIHQAAIESGSGFPYMITTSGSYRLTSGLSVSNANTDAIFVTAANVTIDLNGFTIKGPATCNGFPPTCSAGTGRGIAAESAANSDITVKNGTVRGFASHGICLFQSRIENVRVFANGGDGIFIGDPATVIDCLADGNEGDGVDLNGGLVKGCVFRANGGLGINGDEDVGYTQNSFYDNTGTVDAQSVEVGVNNCDGNTTCP